MAGHPDFARAVQLHNAGLIDEAARLYRAIIAAQPRNAPARTQLALAHFQKGEMGEGLKGIEASLKIDPRQPDALNYYAFALTQLGRLDDAITTYDRLTALAPNDAQAHNARGLALHQAGRSAEALESFERARQIAPRDVGVLNNLAMALLAAGKYHDALAAADEAIALAPRQAEPHNNRANALIRLGRSQEGIKAYDRAIELKPDFAEVYDNRARAYAALGLYEDVIASLAPARALGLNSEIGFGPLLHAAKSLCRWDDVAPLTALAMQRLDDGVTLVEQFMWLALPSTREQQLKAAQLYTAKAVGAVQRMALPIIPARGRKLKIGYFSNDYYNHATTILLAGVLEAHDRDAFEIIGFSWSPERDDPQRTRIERAFDQFVTVTALTEQEIAALSRSMGVDIAVDLKGYTTDARPAIFAQGAAPLQASFLGYPGTMGAPFIDYLIADRTIIPPEHWRDYSEKIAYLPHSYQPNDQTRTIAPKAPSRAECGLPENAFVFCDFNSNYKIAADTFALWMSILRDAEGSVFWLLNESDVAGAQMRAAAAQQGVAPERIVFAPLRPMADHLARLTHADLFLDTFYYGAHTTASDALWMGVPVLTVLGETFAGRVAASLLNAVGLPELIVGSRDAYSAAALDLFADRAKLAAMRQRLARNKLTEPLFDAPLFARHLEEAYRQMWRQAEAGLAPDHLHAEPTTP